MTRSSVLSCTGHLGSWMNVHGQGPASSLSLRRGAGLSCGGQKGTSGIPSFHIFAPPAGSATSPIHPTTSTPCDQLGVLADCGDTGPGAGDVYPERVLRGHVIWGFCFWGVVWGAQTPLWIVMFWTDLGSPHLLATGGRCLKVFAGLAP